MNRVNTHTTYSDRFPCEIIIKLLSCVPYEQSLVLVQLMKSFECNWFAAAYGESQCKHVLSSMEPLGNCSSQATGQREMLFLPTHLHKEGLCHISWNVLECSSTDVTPPQLVIITSSTYPCKCHVGTWK